MPINFTFSDTLKKDKFNAWTGIGQNNGSSLIIGETTINGTINGFNYSSYKTGNYGILYAKSGDINTKPAYRYEPNNDAINALENNTTESFYFSGDGDIDAINMDFVAVNDSPILNTLSSTKFTDNASFNNFTNRMGKLVATDAEQSVITYGIVGGVVSETISTLNDIYGVLTVDIVTGNYTFKTDDVAINALDSTQKHTIVFTASDGNETTSTNWVFNLQGANDTPIITTLQSITFIDTLTNDKPTSKTGIIVASDAEKSPLNFSLNESINVTFLENDITYDLAKTHLAGVFYLNSTTGEYLYVPDKIKINALDVDNLDTFTITVSDGFLSATTSLTLDIQATNDIPIFQKPDSIVLNDTRFADTFTIQTSDLKATDAENANLLYSISGGTIFGDISTLTNSYGTLFVNTATGNYRFEPNKSAINALNTNQSAHFLLSVSDGHLEDIENLYLTINAVNDAPQLTAEPAIFVDGVENTNYEIKTTDLLEGYSDAENDSFFVSELTTNHGVVIKNQHDWLFTPELNYSGDVTMTYTITDTHGDSTIATQHFQLLPLNFAPTLTGEKVNFPNTFKNNSVLLKNQDLLQGFSDKDNDVLSILNLVVNNGHISQIGHDWLCI